MLAASIKEPVDFTLAWNLNQGRDGVVERAAHQPEA
jgi:hypothetical protein